MYGASFDVELKYLTLGRGGGTFYWLHLSNPTHGGERHGNHCSEPRLL